MLYLVTGQPGNGKTLRAMALMVAEYERNQKAVKEGKEQPRRFFSNIAGSWAGDALTPNPDAFPWVEGMPEHNDWTQLPDGSFVIYDEAHSDGKTKGLERYGKLFPSTGKPGESDDPRIRSMSVSRHSGVDIVLITQFPTKIHHQVRTLVGQHIHMTRAMGLAAAGMLTWVRTQPDPYDERQREKAEEEIWHYPKDLYKRYRSASLHTSAHKFRLPKKVKNGLITGGALLLMFAFAVWFFDWDLSVLTGGGGQPQAEASGASPAAAPPSLFRPPASESEVVHTPGLGTYSVINTAPAPTLMGCAASHRGCMCFNTDGLLIDMAERECKLLLAGPLPINAGLEYRRGADSGREARSGEKAEVESFATELVSIGEKGQVPRYGQFRDEPLGPEKYEVQGW